MDNRNGAQPCPPVIVGERLERLWIRQGVTLTNFQATMPFIDGFMKRMVDV
jgi:hypothetical protein